MERDIENIIRNNRKALGYKNDALEDIVVAGLLAVNKVVYLQAILNANDNYPDDLNIILADGVIVGYEV